MPNDLECEIFDRLIDRMLGPGTPRNTAYTTPAAPGGIAAPSDPGTPHSAASSVFG